MKRGTLMWVIGGVVLVVLLFVGGQKWLQSSAVADVLTNEEVEKLIQEKYPGKINQMVLENNQFTVELESESGIYEVKLDEKSGEVLSLRRMVKKEETPVMEPPISEPQPSKVELPKRLTEEEAIKIALGQVSGEVDDIDIENINGISYYIVEIETSDEKEAVIEINAISGEVKSLTWED